MYFLSYNSWVWHPVEKECTKVWNAKIGIKVNYFNKWKDLLINDTLEHIFVFHLESATFSSIFIPESKIFRSINEIKKKKK